MSKDENPSNWSKDVQEAVSNLTPETKSGFPGLGGGLNPRRDMAGDSYTQNYEAFKPDGKYIGANSNFGGTISDRWRLFYSQRDPVGKWWTRGIADDTWDNWFKVVDIEKPDDDDLDRKVQPVLNRLKAKIELPRETLFERRYGTSIFLLSYTGFGDENEWKTPLFTLNPDGTFPKINSKLLQIMPYPWTNVTVTELDMNEGSLRYGRPLIYTITRGNPTPDSSAIPAGGQTATGVIEVHWTRVIHDAPRLDEHFYEGIPAIDAIFDILVGGRNCYWAMFEGYYRNGQGFPVAQTTGTQKENEDWLASGQWDEMMARMNAVHGPDEKIYFAGAGDVMQSPTAFFDTYFQLLAAATGVAVDTIKGVSTGRVTGSESNERKYYKSISLQQHRKEPMLRELIDRLIATGQVDFSGEYIIDWVDPFEINPQDRAAIEFLKERTNNLRLAHMTLNEVRERTGENLADLGEEGEVIVGLPGQQNPTQGNENQQEPSRQPTESENPSEGRFMDEIMKTELEK